MKSILVALIAFCACIALVMSVEYTEQEYQHMFNSFLAKYEKTYAANDVEFQKRYTIFKDNIQRAAVAQKMDRGTATYGVTKFSDLTPEEFSARYLMAAKTPEELRATLPNAKPYTGQGIVNDLPESFDWREKNAISPVKNQGQCGSCWSFSTTGNIESVNFLKNGKMEVFSEQALVDCDHTCDPEDKQTCDSGCNGGLMALAMEYVKENGLPHESDYPYTAHGGTCQYKGGNSTAVSISGYQMGPKETDKLKSFLIEHGGLSAAINAEWMQFYTGGISDPWMCSPKALDHGILISGYAIGKNMFGKEIPYWIIKNSWGANWGHAGYYYIAMEKCGVGEYVVSSLMN